MTGLCHSSTEHRQSLWPIKSKTTAINGRGVALPCHSRTKVLATAASALYLKTSSQKPQRRNWEQRVRVREPSGRRSRSPHTLNGLVAVQPCGAAVDALSDVAYHIGHSFNRLCNHPNHAACHPFHEPAKIETTPPSACALYGLGHHPRYAADEAHAQRLRSVLQPFARGTDFGTFGGASVAGNR